jgi:hypothetical protein
MSPTNAKTTTTQEVPEQVQKLRDQLLSTVQQGQKLSLDAVRTWANAVSILPVPSLPTVPGLPALPDLDTSTTFAFDLADDLLKSQRAFALQLTEAMSVHKSA